MGTGDSIGAAIEGVSLLGSEEAIVWRQEGDALLIEPIKSTPPSDVALVFKLTLAMDKVFANEER